MKPRASWTLVVQVFPGRMVKAAELKRLAKRSAELLTNCGFHAEVGELRSLLQRKGGKLVEVKPS